MRGCRLQGMDPHVRERTSHVLYESNTWVPAFNLSISLSTTLLHLVQNIATLPTPVAADSDTAVAWSGALRGLAAVVTSWSQRYCVFDKALWSFKVRPAWGPRCACACVRVRVRVRVRGAHSAWCCQQTVDTALGRHEVVDYDVGTQRVSFHMPLHRLWGWLACRLPVAAGLDPRRLLCTPEPLSTSTRLALLEYPLRSLVLAAQIREDMWRRNGMTVVNEVTNYDSRVTSLYLADGDRAAVQVGGVCCGGVSPWLLVHRRSMLPGCALAKRRSRTMLRVGATAVRCAAADAQHVLHRCAAPLRRAALPRQRQRCVPHRVGW